MQLDNSIVSKKIHDQKNEDWKCWGFAFGTMIRASLLRFIDNNINIERDEQKSNEIFKKLTSVWDKINHPAFHRIIRSELMMVVNPIRQNEEDNGKDPLDLISRVCVNKYHGGRSLRRLLTFRALQSPNFTSKIPRPIMVIPIKNTFVLYDAYKLPLKFAERKKIISHWPFCEFFSKKTNSIGSESLK